MPRKKMPTPNEATQLHAKYIQQTITEAANNCRENIIEQFTGNNTVRIRTYPKMFPDEVMPVVIKILEKKGWRVKKMLVDGVPGWELSPATKITKSQKSQAK